MTMTPHDLRNLQESYQEMYQLDEAMSSYDRNRKRAAQRAAERNAARASGKTGNVPGVGYVSPRKEKETYTDSSGVERHKSGARMPQKESVDIFDTILDHLVSEGYADSAESALVIMANMSEEWRDELIEGALENVAAGAGRIVGGVQRTASNLARNFEAGRQSAATGRGTVSDRAGGIDVASDRRKTVGGTRIPNFPQIQRNAAAGSVTDRYNLSRYSTSR